MKPVSLIWGFSRFTVPQIKNKLNPLSNFSFKFFIAKFNRQLSLRVTNFSKSHEFLTLTENLENLKFPWKSVVSDSDVSTKLLPSLTLNKES